MDPLSFETWTQRKMIAVTLLQWFQKDRIGFLDSVVTCYETWVYYLILELKRQEKNRNIQDHLHYGKPKPHLNLSKCWPLSFGFLLGTFYLNYLTEQRTISAEYSTAVILKESVSSDSFQEKSYPAFSLFPSGQYSH